MGIAVAAATLPTTDGVQSFPPQVGANVDIGARPVSPDRKTNQIKTPSGMAVDASIQPKGSNRSSLELTSSIQPALTTIAEEGDHVENRDSLNDLNFSLNQATSDSPSAKWPGDINAEISMNSPQMQNVADHDHNLPNVNMEGKANDMLDAGLVIDAALPTIGADGYKSLNNEKIPKQVDASISLPDNPKLNMDFDHPSASGLSMKQGLHIPVDKNITPVDSGKVESSPANLQINLGGNVSIPSTTNDNRESFDMPNRIKKPQRIKLDHFGSAIVQPQQPPAINPNMSEPQQFATPIDDVNIEGVAPKITTNPVIVTSKNVSSPSSHSSDLENTSVNLSWDGSIINDNISITPEIASISADYSAGINADNGSELPIGANIRVSPLANDHAGVSDYTNVNDNENEELANAEYPVS